MKESKFNRQIIVAGLEPFVESSTFAKWPLHITLLPWFGARKLSSVEKAIEGVIQKQSPLVATIGKTALFGKLNDIPVNLIQPPDDFQKLHLSLLNAVHESGAEFEDLSIVGFKYNPHVTTILEEPTAETYQISSLALVSQTPSSYKKVEKVFEFHA